MTDDSVRLIDTHCHLEMMGSPDEVEQAIARALAGGLEAMITVASDPQSNKAALEIARAHDNIYCTVGVHPHEARLVTEEMKTEIRKMASDEKVVAIGETGLDYHYDNSPRDMQREVFRWHLGLARDTGLPAVIHSREADDDTIAILEEFKPEGAVLHCFSGSPALLGLARRLRMYVSIAGPVTFKKAVELRQSVAEAPDELLLIETDSPYLAPVPKRGKCNEPAYVVHTAREVAALRGVTFGDIARITTVNARRAFRLPVPKGQDTVTYKIRNSMYINLTNRCSNRCTFCARYKSDFVKGHDLSLSHEPTVSEIKAGIGDPSLYDEVVFCGFGEPTLRLDVIKEVGVWVKQSGGRVRLNTNGQGSLVHGRDIVPELAGVVDEASVSLDAQDAETYERICQPEFPGAYEAVKDFIAAAAKALPTVKATVVEMDGVDVDACRSLAESLGAGFRVRRYDVVG